MTHNSRFKTIILPEYHSEHLGAPFQVILLQSVRQVIDVKQGRVEKIVIPNERGLLQQVALARILVPRRLSGFEIKFVRKALPIRATSLSRKIGVTPEHLSRCEAGERALSVGTEKCLRIAILLELFKLPAEVQHRREQSEILNRKLVLFSKAMDKIHSIINDMTIPAVYEAEDQLRFYFTTLQRAEKDLFSQEPEGDWTQESRAA